MDSNEVLNRIAGARVLVVGDIMLDRYWWGPATRISPEAPVPVVAMRRETHVLGGAANVAANAFGLGAKVHLAGVVGTDHAADDFFSVLGDKGISRAAVVANTHRPTTVKTRIIANGQQVARVDQESTDLISDEIERELASLIAGVIGEVDVVVLSDYAKGVLSDGLLRSTISTAKHAGKKILVDPKGRDFSRYAGADIITPNQREAMDAFGLSDGCETNLIEAGRRARAELSVGSILVTRGEHGMLLIGADEQPFTLDAGARNVFDVTGAGDTVIASLACCLAAGVTIEEAVRFANSAAGIVIQHVGTTAISRELLSA